MFSPALDRAEAESRRGSRSSRRKRACCPTIPHRARRGSGPFSVGADGEAVGQGEAGADESHGTDQGRSGSVAETGAARKKLETALRRRGSARHRRCIRSVAAAAPDENLFLLYHSDVKPVQERLRNYFQKYCPMVQEITPEEWATIEGKPGTPKYQKARDSMIANRLDRASRSRRRRWKRHRRLRQAVGARRRPRSRAGEGEESLLNARGAVDCAKDLRGAAGSGKAIEERTGFGDQRQRTARARSRAFALVRVGAGGAKLVLHHSDGHSRAGTAHDRPEITSCIGATLWNIIGHATESSRFRPTGRGRSVSIRIPPLERSSVRPTPASRIRLRRISFQRKSK